MQEKSINRGTNKHQQPDFDIHNTSKYVVPDVSYWNDVFDCLLVHFDFNDRARTVPEKKPYTTHWPLFIEIIHLISDSNHRTFYRQVQYLIKDLKPQNKTAIKDIACKRISLSTQNKFATKPNPILPTAKESESRKIAI